ncbi:outer membrane protein OmpA-like peptidoglycan-associated protein [Kushneria sinocarnis]|uniref:Outer membrane protein OmpA-like peptidoglycan-associated protein n=1 Tax=Kushneria sinocarnis TaxID=595502 RepID=A0A420X0P1_9GAMM|nr:OmpA family protein [Kushneria sinocarnis]RKR07269.1 outer membrane protein OmpA-like peptidoglycan-associated protein [Kushneria sinocarnis]
MKARTGWIASLALSVAVAGCSTVNPYTGEQQTSSLAKGSGIGALLGGATGALADNDHRLDHAAIGAAVGALAGGGVGYYMDAQEAKLRQKMQGTGVSVTRQGNQVMLNMPSNITFATDSANLSQQIRSPLDGVRQVLEEYQDTRVQIDGYTDSTGSDSYNQRLSELRAQAVGNYLARGGVDFNRLIMSGHGEDNPIASNDSAQGRAQNRRVEITLVPTQG